MTDALSATFRKPFAEQVAAFRLRLGDLVPTAKWDDIQRSAHDRAFMVAGATKADLLADLAAAVDKAIAEGTGFEEFKRDFRALVKKHGWHGWTGEGTPGGEEWRMRVIYRTNMRTSYMAGRHAQLVEGNFPLWIYRHGGSADPRPQHLFWDGLTLPADHQFWASHYPPNDWGCSCRVFGARSMRAAERRGGKPSVALRPGWDQPTPKTGAPRGIGKGWNYAPGATVSETVSQLRDKLDKLPPRPSADLIQSWLQGGPFEAWFEDPKGNWPLARLSDQDAEAIGAHRRVADISADTARKQRREHPELTATDYAMAQATVSEATHRIKDGPRSLIFVRIPENDQGHVLVVKTTKSGQGLFVTSIRRLSRDEATRDRLIRRLLRRGE
ncbi:phage minor head protein [Phaeobacter inhibens]|uniref:phage head morphogenesis protein n=1 Tax=Phaeobacter inhibens TaxID=221822 RepID=UPI00076BB0D0|nr:phage minor head protein [Phaeobacter inhibens]KXF92096.1 virion morphogenesis protein [Phaeobacter inhibens]WHP69932.1 phage minor head protein [Phaeobacter inhibens]